VHVLNVLKKNTSFKHPLGGQAIKRSHEIALKNKFVLDLNTIIIHTFFLKKLYYILLLNQADA